MSSSGTTKAKKASGSPAKGAKSKKATKRTVKPVEADTVPVADVPEVQVSEREGTATEPQAEPKPTKPRSSACAATSGATDATPTAKPLSCLDAAAAVLADRGVPMRCKDLIDLMASAGLWSSTAPTPAATLYSALLREIATKGEKSRFKKTDRGQFALNK